jgi:predicted Zn-dependent peptidase
MTVPFSHLEDAVKIASEVFFHPTFPEEALEKERNAVLNELKQHLDSQWYKFGKYFRETRYSKSSALQRETIGTEEIIKNVTHDDLVAYWKENFFPHNMYLFLGGNFTEELLQKLLATYMEKPVSDKVFSGFSAISQNDLNNSLVGIRHDPTLQVNYVTFSFPSLDLDASVPLKIKESIALDILGRFRSSRLFRLLRYQKGYVYGVSANDVRMPKVGFSVIDSEVATEHLDEVVRLIAGTLQEYIENGPTDAELGFAKHYLTNQWLMAFDSPGSIGDWVEGQLIWRDKIHLPEDYIAIADTVKKEDIVAVMKKYWRIDKLQLIIQGPIANTNANQEKYFSIIQRLLTK